MKSKTSALTLLAVIATTTIGHSTVVRIGQYGLGEAGSVGASAPFNPLNDSAGTNNEIKSYQDNGGTVTIQTSGLAAGAQALGSTAYLQKAATGASGWHNSDHPYNLNDDWAFDLYFRPDSSGGTYAGSTDNSSSGLTWWPTDASFSGTSASGNSLTGQNLLLRVGTGAEFLGGDDCGYSTGNWYRLSGIVYDGTVYYYKDGQIQDVAATSAHLLNRPMLGFGPVGSAATNGGWDELQFWSFDNAVDSLASVEQELGVGRVRVVGEYHLGESGSLGSPSVPFTPLLDTATADGTQNITNYQDNGGTLGIVTTDLKAPGSTAALKLTGGPATGYHGGTAFTFNDDFAFQIWVNAESGELTGTHDVMVMTNNSGTPRLSLIDGKWSAAIGNNPVFSSTTAAADIWTQLTMIRYDGVSHFVVDGQLVPGTSTLVPTISTNGAPMLFFGAIGYNNFKGILDEARVYTFNHELISLDEVIAEIAPVPEPASWLLLAIALVLAGWYRWRR